MLKENSSFEYLLMAFIGIAFSIYFLAHFESTRNLAFVLKFLSLGFLCAGVYSRNISLNSYDLITIFFVIVLGVLYSIGSVAYGFEDKLFLNFLMFVIPYVWLCAAVSQDKILLSYKCLSVILTAQVWLDIFLLKILKVMPLWPEGSLVGGMGNPSSFAFACNFCLIYLLFIKNSIPQKIKYFMIFSLVIGVVLSNALFMILIMGGIFFFAILFSKGLLRKLIIFSALAFMSLLLIEYVILKGGVLANKLYAVLGNFGLSESEASSDSVSLRVEIFNQILDFINQPGGGFIWGQFNNLSYYAVDSQYITYFLSFGLIGFGAFLTLLVVMLMRAVLVSTQYKKFVIIALGIFILTFFNNRILDYFPIGYLFISLAALISKENSQKELV